MSNPFHDSAQTLLASLDDTVAEQLKSAAQRGSRYAAGIELTIEEVIGLALVARHIAATDGLSTAESNGMRALLSHYGVPPVAQEQLMAIDLSAAILGRPGARAWRRVLSEGAHKPGAGTALVEAALSELG